MVIKFNKSLLTKLFKDVHIYDSIDNVDINKDKTDHIFQEFLQSQTPSGLLPFRLNSKVGAFIILFCKLYPTFGEYNSTQIVIT